MPQPGAMLSDTDIRAQLSSGNGADLRIEKFAEDCVTPVGYDVRAGDTVFSYKIKEVRSLRAGEYVVAPGDTVFISSLETFVLSEKIGGFTVSRLGPQLDGLQLAALSVDPTWRGELLIILTNVGPEPVRVRYQDRLMTICLFWMASSSAKKVDRQRWDNENVIQKFREMEKAASRQEAKKRWLDIGVIAILTGAVAWLRHQGSLESNYYSLMVWSSFAALYFSWIRRIILSLLKLPA